VKKKMTQAYETPAFEIEQTILEELPVELEQPKEVEVKVKAKHGIKALLKLRKKGKYNAKYLEELVSVNEVRRMVHYRNFGVR
jgi:hypothetical protein